MNTIQQSTNPFLSMANGQDYKVLCDLSLNYAQRLKIELGAIPIFGFVTDTTGFSYPIQWPLNLPFPSSSLKGFVLKSIHDNLAAIKAMAICTEVQIRMKNDKTFALQIELSHVKEMPIKAYRGLEHEAWAIEKGINYLHINPQ